MATVLDSIKRYQYIIEKNSHDEHKILKCINRLYHLGVTVQHLQDTGVGRTINALRKEPGEVGPAARSLVQKWKEMVEAEESEEDGYQSHETTTHNGHGSGRESDDNGRQDTRSNTNSTSKLNGNHSGTKREYHSSEDEDANVKRSKHSCNDYKNKSSKIEKEQKRDELAKAPNYDSHESDASDSSESNSSESSVEYDKTKKPDKKEPISHHGTSSKHSSHNNYSTEKIESSNSKKSNYREKHSEHHSSSSKDIHSSEKSSSKDKSHRHDKETSHKHKSSNDNKDLIIPEKKHKSDHKISSKESKSSSKNTKLEDNKSHKHDSSDKHKSCSEKHISKSDKHRSSSQSQNSDKEKHRQLEAETTRHKSTDSHSSSSKEKHSSSSKEKSRDRNTSSKDKSSSHSSDKHSTANHRKSSSSEHKNKSEKHESRSSEKKSKSKSSSSSDHKTIKHSNKTQEDVPKKKDNENHEDSDDGIDCGSGASFAEALGMISPAKPKKKLAQLKDIQSPNSFTNDLSPAALLAPTAKLAPLPALEITALPEISPNYRPRPPPKALSHFTDDEALNAGISSKNQRTKVYSGNKVMGKIPSLYEMCVHILQEHIDALEFTGGVPYNILKPVVDRATPQQLFTLEHFNPYLMEDTDHLWQKFCEKSFRNKQRRELESWREMYLRCQEEQEHRLKALTANIRITQEAKKAPIKQTKMAYVDTVVKPPRNVARKQALHGTAHTSTASPAARVAALASAPNVARVGAVRPPPPTTSSSSHAHKPKKAPLMQKALQFMRGRKR